MYIGEEERKKHDQNHIFHTIPRIRDVLGYTAPGRFIYGNNGRADGIAAD